MKNLGNKVFNVPEPEHEPTIELGSTPLSSQIEKFYSKWGRNYQPSFQEDRPETTYEEPTN